ncbi:MAG: dihydrolipoyl dehydrogenase [bacterium]
MNVAYSFNVVVIGAGIGGYTAAIRASQLGAKVLVVDKSGIGGTCLNKGCIPTKAFKATSDLLMRVKHLEDFGLKGNIQINPDIKVIVQRKNRIVDELVRGIEFLFKSYGVVFKRAFASFVSQNRLRLTNDDGKEEFIESDSFIICTGSLPADVPQLKPDGKFVLTSDEILDIDTLPKKLIIIGAGVIGIEFAFIFVSMGVDITILEVMPGILLTEDRDTVNLITRSLKKHGIKIKTNVKITKAETHNQGIDVHLDTGEVIHGDMVLIAAGRRVNTERLGLENTGVKTGERKQILVNEFLKTTADRIYACGDVIGGKMLAHVAYKEGITAVANLLEGKKQTINYNAIPSVIYSTPEAASVGFSEQKAIENGFNIKIGRFPYRASGKAKAFSQIEGEIKLIVEDKTAKVLGMHIVGDHASDIITQGAMAIQNGLTIHSLIDTVAAHPTYSEIVKEAADDIFSMSIHQPKKLR